MKKDLEFEVNTESALLPFLLSRLSGESRNYIKGLLKRGQIKVDGEMCTDYARPLSPGQRVHVLKAAVAKHDAGLPVLYEDNDLIVIDKPAGMLSIATDSERENTAYRIVSSYVKSRTNSGRVFIVHRLDRETSGVMLLAKSEKVKLALQDNWNDTAIVRGYIAVVEGKVRPPDGTIKSWLKQTKTFFVYSSEKEGDGDLAVTNYKTVQTTDKYSMLDISLETGRKNQIRVHMSDIGHPVAGDKKYGASANPLGRLGLHASVLIIKHPSTGEIMRFEATTPDAFKRVF